jgi:hypothetical protein
MATRDLLIKVDEALYVQLVEAARKARMTPSEYGWTLMEKGRLGVVQPGAMAVTLSPETGVVAMQPDLGPVLAKLDAVSTAVDALMRPSKPQAPDTRKIETMLASILDAVTRANKLVPPEPDLAPVLDRIDRLSSVVTSTTRVEPPVVNVDMGRIEALIAKAMEAVDKAKFNVMPDLPQLPTIKIKSLKAGGWTNREIADIVGCTMGEVVEALRA